MLKSIELSGFKSFADRTRMDFSEGISVLVGPNGSGKSNIVDAIKWVLGEQSVKKLRGGEMADVIFNGSETRAGANFAEVTLAFDNARRHLSVDTAVVAVTRRLYRSGESEYLINRQTARLKDIRELLAGTGLGLQTYSIIEQGRVELLLQSTALQRRGVLEDAAGIARFNAKKLETARRLERVDQNRQQLGCIVNEVTAQLRNVKSQAGKAQLHHEYTERLKMLRTRSSLAEWRRKTAERETLERLLDELTARELHLDERIKSQEGGASVQNEKVEMADEQLRVMAEQLSQLGSRRAGLESTIEFQLEQGGQLEQEIVEHGRQFLSLHRRRGDIDEQWRKTDDELTAAKLHREKIVEQFAVQQSGLEALVSRCEAGLAARDEQKKSLHEKTLAASRLDGEIRAMEARIPSATTARVKVESRLDALRRQLDEMVLADVRLAGEMESHQAQMAEQEKLLAERTARGIDSDERLRRERDGLAELKERLSELTGRIGVLDDLLKNRDGVSAGVREVLQKAKDPESPFYAVHGLVADLIRVNAEAAPLIETALGADAQFLVISPEPKLLQHIETHRNEFAGRTGFIWLDPVTDNAAPWRRKGKYDGRPGVLGRADRFVETEPAFERLVWRLLGRTWFVETLDDAKTLYRESDGLTTFMTLAGEVLAGNGTLVVGPATDGGGLITRRTELRALLAERDELEIARESAKIRVGETTAESRAYGVEIKAIQKKIATAEHALEAIRLQRSSERSRDQKVRNEYEQLTREEAELIEQEENLTAELAKTRALFVTREAEMTTFERLLADHQVELERSDAERQAEVKKGTVLKIELAKSEERLDFLTARLHQLEESRNERFRLLESHQQRYRSLSERLAAAELTALEAESQLATLAAEKERLTAERAVSFRLRREHLSAKKKTDADLKRLTDELSKNRESVHLREMEIERIFQEQRMLAERMREDYGIDLAAESILSTEALETACGDDSDEFVDTVSEEGAIREIEELKERLRRLGSVNLEAIETLESLESRSAALLGQYNDLVSARRNIQRIIEKINVEGQSLFEATFEAVKIYFCEIFQKLFGGGHADLVFEDPSNPMESGVEIVVRPPGKELKNVTLLSGGEKTLTCVAFLLAIFRYRAGPVCILDEVDAALDEGNIGRFTSVVKEFQTDTQFFIVTHSKKTMTAAKTMYGVTMEDSGVSKLISVEFDDVGEDGEILLRREGAA